MQQPMPIIVGAPRSGTTLLRFMLDAHPELAIPPETAFFSLDMNRPDLSEVDRRTFFETIVGFPADAPAWADFHLPKEQFWARLNEIEPFTRSAGYRAFYQLYAARFGKPRAGATRRRCTASSWIGSTRCCPRRISSTSCVTAAMSACHCAICGSRPAGRSRFKRDTGAISFRLRAITAPRPRRYLEVKYEELLIAQPEAVLRRICAFVGLPYVHAMLPTITRARPSAFASTKRGCASMARSWSARNSACVSRCGRRSLPTSAACWPGNRP